MEMSRIDALKSFLAEDPRDSFSRYALAMEYAKLERLDDAIAEFRQVHTNDPDYVATYFQLAKTYERADRNDEAEKTYREGIGVATRIGDAHTRDELTEALNVLLDAG